MIGRRELDDLRSEWSLDVGVIEKDYVLGWLLAGIAAHPELAATWIFKGGTCLRKCYYETFRFSEDLDFTVIDSGPEEPVDLQRIFATVGEWLQEEAGIDLILADSAFRRRQNRRGHPTTQGRIAYRGPNPTRGVLPKVKFDITFDEILTQPPTVRLIGHQYSDQPLPVRGVASYPITELFGEKLRALAERCRPRDLYDVIHLHRHPDLMGQASAVAAVLRRKCEHAGIEVPTLESIRETRSESRFNGSGRTCSAINFRDRCPRSRVSGPPLMTYSGGWPAPGHRSICPAQNWATWTPIGRRHEQSRPGAEDSHSSCCVTPARTVYGSRSTTDPSRADPAPESSSPTPSGGPGTATSSYS